MGRMYRIGVGDPERTILLRSRCFRSLALILGAVAALVALAACSDDTPPAAAPTPNIEAMVEARVQATLAAMPMPMLTPTPDIEGIIEAKVQEALAVTLIPAPTLAPNTKSCVCANACDQLIALSDARTYARSIAIIHARAYTKSCRKIGPGGAGRPLQGGQRPAVGAQRQTG